MMTANGLAQTLEKACGVAPGSHVLAAVSGGADSIALLCLLADVQARLSIRVSCAHVEHGIRGEASKADMAFVRALCEQKKIPFYAREVSVPDYAAQHGLGVEEAARALRMQALREIADEVGASHIALAHHAMDQAETVLMHAARGSDVRGLCAMRMVSGRTIRPLLQTQPQALRDYLSAIGQSWREDETNADTVYARNRVRHEVLPALMQAYPGAVDALCRLAQAAQRDEAYFAARLAAADVPQRRLVDGIAFSKAALLNMEDALLGRFFQQAFEAQGFGAQGADVIARLIAALRDGQEETINLSGGAHAVAAEGEVYLLREQSPAADTPLALDGRTETPFGVFTVREATPGETGDGITSQAIDEQALLGAVVSQRREGDAMIPFGRKTPVKLKKLMIDAGVPRPIRNSLPVLRRGEDGKEILWAVGLRPSTLCAARGGRRLMLEYISK